MASRGFKRKIDESGNTRFLADIDKFIKKANDKTDQFTREFCKKIAEEVIQNTPVDTGNTANNWVSAVDAEPANKDRRAEPSATDALDNARDAAQDMKVGRSFKMRSYVPYIRRLEYGSSTQAPQGMVRVTLARAKIIASEILNKLKE